MPKDSKMVYTISCGACIYRTAWCDLRGRNVTEVLLVQPDRNRDVWGIPKGHLDPGETVQQCAVRETIEETGFTPVLIAPLPDVKVKHSREHKTVRAFLATLDESASVKERDRENFQIMWWDIDALPSIHRYQIPLLEEVVRILKNG